jgi:hypothetical protein
VVGIQSPLTAPGQEAIPDAIWIETSLVLSADRLGLVLAVAQVALDLIGVAEDVGDDRIYVGQVRDGYCSTIPSGVIPSRNAATTVPSVTRLEPTRITPPLSLVRGTGSAGG